MMRQRRGAIRPPHFLGLLPTIAAMGPEEGLRAMVLYLFARKTIDFRQHIVDEWVRLKLELPQTPIGAADQTRACLEFSSTTQADQIASPTLIIGGQEAALFALC